METRTQWELAGVTLAVAIVAGAYTLGKSASDDSVGQLERTVASYEKANKLNTEEFLDSALSAISELELSVAERKQLEEKNNLIDSLNEALKEKDSNIYELSEKIVHRDDRLSKIEKTHESELAAIKTNSAQSQEAMEKKIASLELRLQKYESRNFRFSLKKGEGVNLREGIIQVGYANDNGYDNVCDISINNEHKKMKAGDFVESEGCRVTLTKCVYDHPEVPVSFEMVCQ